MSEYIPYSSLWVWVTSLSKAFREKEEGENLGELEGMGWVGWRKGGYGGGEVNILIKGAILGFARDLSLEGFPGPSRGPQIVPWAAEERVPELALSIAILMNILHITIEPSSGDGWR